jgi:hypothetical protein
MEKTAEDYANELAKLDTIVEGKDFNKNYDTGEFVKDLIPKDIPEFKQGVHIEDSNYEDDMYSEEQLKRHADSGVNPFTVDGIPSRWYHNKLRSTWHFDPKKNPYSEEPFKVICKFTGDWSEGISRAISRSTEHTIGNYRKRGQSLQDKSLHDGELLDIQRASGRDDVSCMYYDTICNLKGFDESGKEDWKIDDHPAYTPFFKMFKEIGMYDVHMSRVHIQRLGQVTPFHIDQQMRYARNHWRKRWTDAGADKNPLKLRRVLISLTPWDYGHVWQFGNTYYQGYDAGECVVYDWCNMPHAAANMGYTPRITLQATGFMSEKFEWLLDNGSKDYIIAV